MAHETSSPKIRAIMTTAIIAVIVLVGLKFVFDSYFITMMEEEEARKQALYPPVQLDQLRASENQHLTSGALPIDKAMTELATRGRENPSLKELPNADIAPQASNDPQAMIGWTQLGVDAASVPQPRYPDGGEATSLSDAGQVIMTGEGGVVFVGDAAPEDLMPKDGAAPTLAPRNANKPEAGAH